MQKLFLVLAGVVTLASLTACTSEMSLNKEDLDLSITVGGDSLSLPLGFTDSLTIEDFLNTDSVDFLFKDENGNYYLEISTSFDQTFPVSQYADQMSVPGLSRQLAEKHLSIPDLGLLAMRTGTMSFDLNMEEEIAYEVSFQEAKDSGLVSIKYLKLRDTYMSPEVHLTSTKTLPEGLTVELEVEVPSHYDFEESEFVQGDLITFSGVMDANEDVVFNPIHLEQINLNLGIEDAFEFVDTFKVHNIIFTVDENAFEQFMGSDLTIRAYVNLSSDDGRLHADTFCGKVDLELPAIEESIELTGIPDILKGEGVSLDFANPHARLTMTTNAGVPVMINAHVLPYSNGVADRDRAVAFSMAAPFSADWTVSNSIYYWLSEEQPADMSSEYTWVEADISSLLQSIPDNISMNIGLHSIVDSPEDHILYRDADYHFTGDVKFNMPIALGQDFHLPVRDTLEIGPDVADVLAQSLSVTDIVIGGQVNSSFPVSINLEAYFLDAAYNVLDIPAVQQTIESASADGETVITPLNMLVSRTDIAGSIAYLVFTFELNPGDAAGVALSDDSMIQAEIFLQVTGGLTFDLGENF